MRASTLMTNDRSTRHRGCPRGHGRRLVLRAALGLLPALGLGHWSGCGDDGIGRRYAVNGTVTYKGTPVKQGTITFEPVEPDGRVAAAKIADGHYSLTTLQPGDGAKPGKYRVTVVSKDLDEALASNPQVQKAEDPQKQAHALNKVAKSLVPVKYQLADTSGLTAEVKTSSNRIDFELTD
jgi:hypothetical protein